MMKKAIISAVVIFLVSCGGEKNDTYFTPEKAIRYFKMIEEICNRDDGELWGENLYGPLMFVDRSTRRIVANEPDKNGLLREKEGIYTGSYPRELIINNIAVDFGGKLFALSPLPGTEDEYRLKTRAIHSLFHRFQQAGGVYPVTYNTNHLDEKDARIWVKLEWKALRKALFTEGPEQQQAVRDALIFRGARRELYPKFTEEENKFESYEGLATFTYTLLSTGSSHENRTRLIEYLDRIYSFQSYSRSYGFVLGALYANLLHQGGFDIKSIRTDTSDLGSLVRDLYEINLPEICRDVAGSLALNYEIDLIYREEEKRVADIRERIHSQVSVFTEKPVVFLELESPYFDFEPEDIHFLDTLGTIYNSIRVSDNWGKLSVDKGGCLVSNNLRNIRITAKGLKERKTHYYGDGWHLILNSGWDLVEMNDNYAVRRVMP
ncbi:MAG: hypothetical protein R6W81_07225 [Bacteroidales bacterium]